MNTVVHSDLNKVERKRVKNHHTGNWWPGDDRVAYITFGIYHYEKREEDHCPLAPSYNQGILDAIRFLTGQLREE